MTLAHGLTGLALDHDLPVEVTVFFLVGGAAEECGRVAETLGGQIGRAGEAGEFEGGGGKVPEGRHVPGARAGGDATGPARGEGHPDAAFIQVTLDAAEGAAGAEEGVVLAVLGVRAVVGSEDHERVFVEAERLELGQQAADIAIEAVHHRGKEDRRFGGAGLAGPGAGGLHCGDGVGGTLEVGVRRGGAEVEVERFPRRHGSGTFEEVLSLGGEEIVGVGAFLVTEILLERLDGGVAIEKLGILVVGVGLVDEAVERIPALAPRRGIGVGLAEAPLADHGGGVARGAEALGDGEVAGLEGDTAAVVAAADEVVAHSGVAGVVAGQERIPRGCADSGAGVVVGEDEALAREAVDIGCGVARLAVEAHLAVAEVIGQDEDQVGTRVGLRSRDGDQRGEGGSEAPDAHWADFLAGAGSSGRRPL